MGDCGIAAVASKEANAYESLFWLLRGVQHRGQLSCGITIQTKRDLVTVKDLGLVQDVLSERGSLEGRVGIGHVRYATTGVASDGSPESQDRYLNTLRQEAQPDFFDSQMPHLQFALAFNGQLTNDQALRAEFVERGYRFKTETDTEVMKFVIADELAADRNSAPHLKNVFGRVMDRLEGAYNIVFVDGIGRIAALSDPHNFHPLAYAQNHDSLSVASEDAALRHLTEQAEFGFVEPGEFLLWDGKTEKHQLKRPDPHPCSFEKVYFMRLDSSSIDTSVHHVRTQLGQLLAENEPLRDQKDVLVVAVPDTAKTAAGEFARSLGLQFREDALLKYRYGGRNFIEPPQSRSTQLKWSYSAIGEILRERKVVVVDDSLVRGDASKTVVQLIRGAGAKEVHFRVTFPPIIKPCIYGMDFPVPEKLLANQVGEYRSQAELERKVAERIGADSFRYLTQEMLAKATGASSCMACTNGQYPTKK